jgi:hypothetical protein
MTRNYHNPKFMDKINNNNATKMHHHATNMWREQ